MSVAGAHANANNRIEQLNQPAVVLDAAADARAQAELEDLYRIWEGFDDESDPSNLNVDSARADLQSGLLGNQIQQTRSVILGACTSLNYLCLHLYSTMEQFPIAVQLGLMDEARAASAAVQEVMDKLTVISVDEEGDAQSTADADPASVAAGSPRPRVRRIINAQLSSWNGSTGRG